MATDDSRFRDLVHEIGSETLFRIICVGRSDLLPRNIRRGHRARLDVRSRVP